MKLILFVIGPSKVGKTRISNYLADLSDTLNSQEYHPTQGVRILECERSIPIGKSRKEASVDVEIWDCSGDSCHHSSWPALSADANAVFYIRSSESKSDSDIETWQSLFPHLKSSQVTIFSHHANGIPKKPTKLKINNKVWSKSAIVNACFDQDQEFLKLELDRLLVNAVNEVQESKEKEEQMIVSL